jgi:hypothetical protein
MQHYTRGLVVGISEKKLHFRVESSNNAPQLVYISAHNSQCHIALEAINTMVRAGI